MNTPNNVIPLLTRADRENEAARGQKDTQEQKAISDAYRAKSIRKRLNEKIMITNTEDRIRVAQNLGRILNEMKAAGCDIKKVLRDLQMGSDLDSTKQLYNYTLSEDSIPEKNSVRVNKLTKKAALYLRIAEGAAKAINRDPETIVLRLFENTSYQVESDIPEEKIASMGQMREILTSIGNAAIHRNDLKSYAEILQSNLIGWDIDGSFGNLRSLPLSIFIGDRAVRHVSYLGYAPTVFLCSQHVGPVQTIEGEAFQIDFDKDADAVSTFLFEGKSLPKKYRMPVKLSIYREIWFGIGPLETSWTWKPIFEKRLLFRIDGHLGRNQSVHVSTYDPTIVHSSQVGEEHGSHRLLWLHQYTLLPRSPIGASLSVSVSPHIDTVESIGSQDIRREHLEDRWLIALDRFDAGSLSVDEDVEGAKGQFFYETVDLASCTKYLDQVADPDDWDNFETECSCVRLNHHLWDGEEAKEGWYRDFSIEGWPAKPVNSPRGSIARAIEQNLLQDDDAYRLDTLLFETVAERVQAASSQYRQVLQKRDEHIARLLDSWRSI